MSTLSNYILILSSIKVQGKIRQNEKSQKGQLKQFASLVVIAHDHYKIASAHF